MWFNLLQKQVKDGGGENGSKDPPLLKTLPKVMIKSVEKNISF